MNDTKTLKTLEGNEITARPDVNKVTLAAGGSSPACPQCGHHNAMLTCRTERLPRPDVRKPWCWLECRDCGALGYVAEGRGA